MDLTSKYASPVILTTLSAPSKDVGKVIEEAELSQTAVPSGKVS